MSGTIACNLLCYTWTIDNFSSKLDLELVESPKFAVHLKSPVTYYLELYPNGNKPDCRDYVSILICNIEKVVPKLKTQLSILDSRMNKVNSCSFHETLHSNTCWGYSKFIERSYVMDRRNRVLLDDKLQIVVELSSSDFSINYWNTEVETAVARLQEFNDFEQLLCNADAFPDVTLSVRGQLLPAHKCILSARSAVFRAMFEHSMRESSSNFVVITDVRAPVMRELLRFVYVGKLREVDRYGLELLAAANKYDVAGAKLACEASLCATLNYENAVEYYRLADMHVVPGLKRECVKYMTANAVDVVKSAAFRSLEDYDEELYGHLERAARSAMEAAAGGGGGGGGGGQQRQQQQQQ